MWEFINYVCSSVLVVMFKLGSRSWDQMTTDVLGRFHGELKKNAMSTDCVCLS